MSSSWSATKGRERAASLDGSHLLNFRTAPRASSTVGAGSGRRQQSRFGSGAKQRAKEAQSEAAERRARLKMSSTFFLHSSASHAFVLSRRSSSGDFSFAGPDAAVKWEAVRLVKGLLELESEMAACPICLDSHLAPRITKCGHVFCLACILRYFHAADQRAGADAKRCPCCAEPTSLSQLRPVKFMHVASPSNSGMHFTKLHRVKTSHAPFVPSGTANRYLQPNALPEMDGKDALFCRFNYIQRHALLTHLEADIYALLTEKRRCINNNENLDVDFAFLSMAIRDLQQEKTLILNETNEEERSQKPFEQSHNMSHVLAPHLRHLNVNQTLLKGNHGEGAATALEADKGVAGSVSSTARESTAKGSITASTERTTANPVDLITIDTHKSSLEGDLVQNLTSTTIHPASKQQHRKESGKTLDFSITPRGQKLIPGSWYLDDDCTQFYQASDGQLVFLSGFNMMCLTTEFSTYDPKLTPPLPGSTECTNVLNGENGLHDAWKKSQQQHSTEKSNLGLPLPDCIQGHVLDVERVHLTPAIRKSKPFLSHLSLYTDILFVELDLFPMLSKKTRDLFRVDMERRRKKRQSSKHAERKANYKIQQEEEARVNHLKMTYPKIDPNDEFFYHPSPSRSGTSSGSNNGGEILTSFSGEEFGPALVRTGSGDATPVEAPPSSPPTAAPLPVTTTTAARPATNVSRMLSFREVCAANRVCPSVVSRRASIECDFPVLSAASPPQQPLAPAGSAWKPSLEKLKKSSPVLVRGGNANNNNNNNNITLGLLSEQPLIVGKKKGTKKKIVLLSTSGHRGI